MPSEYQLTIHDSVPPTTERFEAEDDGIRTESTDNGERITVYAADTGALLLEAFVPNGMAYTLRKTD